MVLDLRDTPMAVSDDADARYVARQVAIGCFVEMTAVAAEAPPGCTNPECCDSGCSNLSHAELGTEIRIAKWQGDAVWAAWLRGDSMTVREILHLFSLSWTVRQCPLGPVSP